MMKTKSRDNARTPMQWDDSENAGFTTGTPWLGVNANYTRINMAAQMNDPDSVRSFYKSMIALRAGQRRAEIWRVPAGGREKASVLLRP